MLTLLIGSALVLGIGVVTENVRTTSKKWASWEEQQAFEREREKWRNACRPF